MPRVLIWDLPIRAFHAVFAGSFVAAAAIALGGGEESPLFPVHSMLGLVIGVALGLRIVWGFVGSRHARFASFAFGPGAVARYMRAALTGKGERHAGHNPGAAMATFAMFAIVCGLVVTGVMLGLGQKGAKDIHEVLSYAMVAVVMAHLAGLAVHTMTHRELIGLSMVDGRKVADPSDAIRSQHPLAAVAFLAVVGAFAAGLWWNYDRAAATTRLPLIGTLLQLGETPAEREREHEAERR